jgi:hypothetical protein
MVSGAVFLHARQSETLMSAMLAGATRTHEDQDRRLDVNLAPGILCCGIAFLSVTANLTRINAAARRLGITRIPA